MADVSSGSAQVQGEVAEDSAAAGYPLQIGGRFHASIVNGDQVDDLDVVMLQLDSVGGVVKGHRADSFHAAAEYTTAQTATEIQAAPGASLKLYVTDVVLSTDTAMTMSLDSGATLVIPNKYFAANGGMATHFQTPIECPANTSLTFTSSAAGNHSVQVEGYIAP